MPDGEVALILSTLAESIQSDEEIVAVSPAALLSLGLAWSDADLFSF